MSAQFYALGKRSGNTGDTNEENTHGYHWSSDYVNDDDTYQFYSLDFPDGEIEIGD